jgi:hypothetical protein
MEAHAEGLEKRCHRTEVLTEAWWGSVDFKILTDRVVVAPFIPDRYFSLAEALMQVV